jgi:hypothetical protein
MDLVRVQVEILYPGAKIVGQTNIPMYLRPPRPFLSRPRVPVFKLGETMDTIVIQEQAARAHFQSMGTSMDMITLGDLDFLLTLHTEEALFRPWIDDWIAMAVKETREPIEEPVASLYHKWCRLAVFDTDINTETIRFAGWLPEGDKLREVLEAK